MWWFKPEVLKQSPDPILDIRNEFTKARIDRDDKDYAYVDLKLLKSGLKLYRAVLWKFKVDRWHRRFQCEDFSRLLRICMSAAYRNLKGEQTAESPFVGCVEYTKRNGDRHEIVVMRFVDGWRFYEPQRHTEMSPINEVFLDDSELESITSVEF